MRQKWGSVGDIGQGKAWFFHPMQSIQAKFTNPEEYKNAIMVASLWGMRGSSFFTGGGGSHQFFFCSVASIDGEFMIGIKNCTVMSEAEDGNIFKAEVTMNPSAASETSTAPPEAEDIENEEVQAWIFDAITTVQPGRVALTPNDLVNLCACGLKIEDDNQSVLENAVPPDELEGSGLCHKHATKKLMTISTT